MAKFNDIRALAEIHARAISRSPRDWTSYLDTAARLYRYDFADGMLIHAQRPEATACAELEVWNSKLARWINRGAKGIALIDDTGPRKRLRYVFDISDTHLVMGGRDPWLWRINKDNEDRIINHLTETYNIDLPGKPTLSDVLMELAKQTAEENLDDAMDGLSYEVKDSFLEELDEDTIRYQFRTLLTNSAFYMMAKRCGLEPMDVLEPDDFTGVTDFNSLAVLTFLGNATHEIAEPVLRDIGRELAAILREQQREKMQQGLANSENRGYNEFSTLKRESENENHNEGDDINDAEHGDQLSAEGGLSVPESDDRGQPGDLREVRNASEELSEGEQEELVSEHDADREAGEPSERDRRDSERETGADDFADGESGGRDGENESGGPDDLGSPDEQHSEQSRRDHPDGFDLQLIEETTEQDLTEAEDEVASALSLPDLPTANAQRRMIEQPMAALYAGEIKIPSDVVDEILRTGSNHARSQLRIIYNYMIEQSSEDYTDFIRREYGKGGKGFVIDGRNYSIWFDELGMQIAVGHTVDDRILDKAFLSWDDVSGRIQQLLNQGEYAPQVVLDAARGNALHEHAEALSFMEGDMAEGVSELVFDDMELFSGGYPDRTERIEKYLSQQENVLDLVDRLEGLAAAYEEDPSVMRFKYYAPDRMLAQFQKFAKEAIPFEARDGFEWNEHEMFITQNEIDAYLARGGAYSNSRLATYSFFLNHEDNKKRADFIKEQFGTGGSSHALSGADDSHADYGSKGLRLERGNYGAPYAKVEMTWTKVAQRIDYLIKNDKFMTAKDFAAIPAYEREQMAAKVIWFFERLPSEIERPYKGSMFDIETREVEVPAILEDPERTEQLLQQMDEVLAALPLDSEWYKERAQYLSDLHGYVDGTFTLFPQPIQEAETITEGNGQLTLFDVIGADMEPPIEQAALDAIPVAEEPAAQITETKEPVPYETEEFGRMKTIVINPHITVDRYGTIGDFYLTYRNLTRFTSDDLDTVLQVGRRLNELEEEADVTFLPEEQVEQVLAEARGEQPQQTLQPLTAEAANEYNELKAQYPDALVGFEQHGHYEFYGEDARRAAEILGTKLLDKTIPGGTVSVTGFVSGQWVANAKKLWGKGVDVYLAGETEDGKHEQTKYLLAKDYLPKGAVVHIDGREFWIDSVDFANDRVSLQDMTMLRQARFPIFRDEPIEFVRSYLEEEQPTIAQITAEMADQLRAEEEQATDRITDVEDSERAMTDPKVEADVFEALEATHTAFEDYSPEQMDVIYSAAEKGYDLEPLCNPAFSPEQMQLISDIEGRMEARTRASFREVFDFITKNELSIGAINDLRAANNLPLEDVPDESKVETPTKTKPKLREIVIDLTPREKGPEYKQEPINFRITDDDLGAGGPKAKFRANMDAIYLLKKLENEGRLATPEEQEVLSRFVGWGGISKAFDAESREWSGEFAEVKAALTPEEYREARASTLNAFYTSPTVIKAMYEALGNFRLSSGNVLEPSCGVGNFMGLVPESMNDLRMYGVELDSISGRIAKQLYQKNQIAVQGFETTEFPDSFFDVVIGNVPFGQYKVNDRKYDRYNFLIHDYFIARSLDLTRPGGVVAVITSSGTMDKQNESVRQYLANRADLIGAIRLPDNAFMRNANTGVVADILFFQKRDRAAISEPEWVHLGTTPEGYSINEYFVQHPEMVLGEFSTENTQYGKQEVTVKPIEGADLADQLHEAIGQLKASIEEVELTDSELDEEVDTSIPADPTVKNFSFTNVEGKVYYRENSRMNRIELPAVTTERILGMIEIRNTVQKLLDIQLNDGSDAEVALLQQQLNEQYDAFAAQYGIISSSANKRAFQQDSSYCLLSSLEVLDEEGNMERKADIFSKRTIRKAEPVTSVDTASEALAVSIGEKAGVDLLYMAELTGKSEEEIVEELQGVIFKNPLTDLYETSDAYLSGNVREKLRVARQFAENNEEYAINVEFLEKVQPKELDASEIEVRLGATWVKPEYIQQFMGELLQTPWYLLGRDIQVKYAEITGQWNISGKTRDSYGNALVTSTYGTSRANAYRLLEDALNLKDTKIYDNVEDADGKQHRVLNKKETMLAQQKQEMIREAFKEWVFRDIDRREDLCKTYNELFNSIRPREYDGSHIRFVGMTPEIQLMQHQKNAVAHILYGNNTLLAHCVGAGKTFQMIAAGMESKRLGLAQKCLYVVPNHLTEQWGSDFLRLYPGANILVATKKDFEPANRKKFCSRIATGDYDAIIIGHSQFEKIPLSRERQIASIEKQIDDLEMAIEEAALEEGSRYTVKQMEKTRKALEARLAKLNDQTRKDDVVTFEELGIDRLFVDESHNFKNLFLYTKMRNVAGIAQTDAQKSSDMFMKCQYMDEITGGRGITFATGTPVSNSMVELYTIMRYLQYDTLQKMGMGHFDSWAASFGETVTAIELSPEGTGYRAKTRFARFFNLPELISIFKEAADVQTADMLNLPVPEAEYLNEVLEPSEEQQDLVSSFADRAENVRKGGLDPRIDNMLKITNDGRKCALDQRLINDMLPDAPESKVNLCVENAFQVWQESTPDKGTQLIFCDLSTPKADGTFNVYDDLREKLVAKGVPREEIVFIHEANTEAKKAELFAKVRAGQVRILVGSTPKLGAGTNVQDRLIALHHLDCPWKPSDLEQQEGRILRQGNRNDKVKIFRYVTEGTFDAYMWQILENKQKFISQIMTSKSPVRACEDVDDTALSYAEIKALATGNPYIKEKMDLDIQVSKLKLMKASHTSTKYKLETDIARNYPVQITATKERLAGLKADMAAAKPILEKDKEHFSMVIVGKEFTDRKEAGTALIAACAGLKAVNTSGQIGEYHGFSMSASFDSFHQVYQLTLKRQCSYTIEISKDALGNIQRINNALAGIEKKATEAEQKLENLQKQLTTAQEEVKKPFAQEAELAEKSARLAELNSMLNMDEKDSSDTLGVDEETDVDVAERNRQATTYAGRVSDRASRDSDATARIMSYADRAMNTETGQKNSVLERLRVKKEEVSQAKTRETPSKKHEQSL